MVVRRMRSAQARPGALLRRTAPARQTLVGHPHAAGVRTTTVQHGQAGGVGEADYSLGLELVAPQVIDVLLNALTPGSKCWNLPMRRR